MSMGKQIRRLARLAMRMAAGVAAAALIAAATLPYWLEQALRPLAARHGIVWAAAVREGRQRVELRNVRAAFGTAHLQAAAVRVKLPGAWIVGLIRRDKDPVIEVDGWLLALTPEATTDTAAPERFPFTGDPFDRCGRIWHTLMLVAPHMSATRGVVRTTVTTFDAEVPHVEWTRAGLHGAVTLQSPEHAGVVTTRWDAGLAWPAYGRLAVAMNLEGRIEAGALPWFPATLTSGTLHVHAYWNRGPLQFNLEHAVEAELPDRTPVEVKLGLQGDARGIALHTLAVSVARDPLLHATGRLPLFLSPGSARGERLTWPSDAPLALRAETEPGAGFWAAFGNGIPAWPLNPVLSARIDGSRDDPRGRIRVRADRIDYTLSEDPALGLPSVSDIELDIEISEAVANLNRLFFRIAEQDVSITAKLPLGSEAWQAFVRSRRLPHWSRIEGSLTIPEAEVGAFRQWFPDTLAPTGRFMAALQFNPGGKLTGSIRLRDAATRPIMPTGALTAIQGDVVFDERTMRIERFSGRIGDRQVAASGSAVLADDFSVRYSLALKGAGIPLVRQPGLLLRGDVDLLVTGMSGSNAFARIDGDIDLQHGYFLSELRLPTPGSLTVPGKRPPYFSVETEPFCDWDLNVRIRGESFMHVRSPVFAGVLSADLHAAGTLQNPVMPGQVDIDSGTVRLPFGTLGIERGRLLMTPENPFQIVLEVLGSGRVFGYDIGMLISGSDAEPSVEFTSTPPLGSDAILLMLTAGQLPEREIEFTGQQRAARVALFLGQNLLYELTGDETVSDRLVIESGRNISRDGRGTYAIRYRLSDRLSVTGDYDEYDAVNAGIRWRLFSR